jgi:hypothetical protein
MVNEAAGTQNTATSQIPAPLVAIIPLLVGLITTIFG